MDSNSLVQIGVPSDKGSTPFRIRKNFKITSRTKPQTTLNSPKSFLEGSQNFGEFVLQRVQKNNRMRSRQVSIASQSTRWRRSLASSVKQTMDEQVASKLPNTTFSDFKEQSFLELVTTKVALPERYQKQWRKKESDSFL